MAAWLLKDATKRPDPEVKSLARLLDSPDPRMRYLFAQKLAEWYGGDAPPAPRNAEAKGEALRLEFPGLDANVAAWKRRLRALP